MAVPERTIGWGTTAPPQRQTSTPNGVSRTINICLGLWLFVSAFLWQHSPAQYTNTWLCGVVGVMLAFLAVAYPAVRYLNTLLAIWLFISVFTIGERSIATTWNNALVAAAIFFISLTPSSRRTYVPPRTPRPA